MRRGLRSGLVASCNEIYNVVKSSGNRFYLVMFMLMMFSSGAFGQGTITINLSSAGGSGNLGTTNYASGAERTWTQSGVTFGGKAITANGSNIQGQASNAVFYNTTALPGRILSVVINYSGTARNYALTGGNTSRLVNSTAGNYTTSGTAVGSPSSTGWVASNFDSTNYTFFAMKLAVGSSSQISSIVITYETGSTVTFNGNGSTGGSTANQTASTATNLTANGFTRTNYNFSGWNTASDGTGTAYADGASYPFAASTTLFAQWRGNVSYNANGGTGTVTDATNYAPGQSVTTASGAGFTRSGYTFIGWNTLANGLGTSYTANQVGAFNFAGNTTLYAVWNPVGSHTVIFEANGGTGSMANQTESASAALNANAFTRAGYAFANWNTAANGSGTTYANGQTYAFDANMTLYAQWTANNNTITFDANTGTGTMAAQILATGAAAALNANTFTKAGYTFAGWATTAGGAVAYANSASYSMGTSNVTLYAKWTANNNTITFNGNGSTSGTMANQTIATDASANLTTNAFVRTGYTFASWNTASDGSGTAYANGASYVMGTSNVTLYAQWDVYVGPCLSENFGSGSMPSSWIDSDTGTAISYGAGYADMSIASGSITMIAVANPNSLTFDLSRTSNATAKNLNIEVSTTSQTSGFSTVTNYDHSNTVSNSTTACTVDLSAYSSSPIVYIRFNKTTGTTSPWRIDNINVFCEPPCTPAADPVGSISGTTPACTSTVLTYTGADAATAYWQTTATGTSTSEPATSTKSVTLTGDYYVRINDGTCWSTNSTAAYSVTINSLPTAAGTPSPANAATGVCYSGGSPVTSISWTAVAGATSYDVYFGAGSMPGSVTSNVTGTSYSTGTLAASTTYHWKVVAKNGCGSAIGTSDWSFTTASGFCYCTPTGSLDCSTWNDYISNVTLNTLNYTSACGAGGYTIVPAAGAQTTILTQGEGYTFSLTSGPGTGTHGAGVYFDWNQDGDFIDPSEFVLINNSIGANSTVTATVTVPAGAAIGSTRMRVRYAFEVTPTFANSCSISGAEGETEDYTISVIAPCTPAANPVGTIAGTTPACTSTVLTYAAADAANAYWQSTATGTSFAEPVSSTTKTVSTSGTHYLRIHDGSCWSTNSISYAVVINAATVITVQPSSTYAVVGNTASFTVTATGTGLSYQWQQKIGAGSWTNVGTNSNSFTTPATTLAMDGYLYQVIVSGTCGNVTSGSALLSVGTVSLCNPIWEENFDSGCADNNLLPNINSNWTRNSGSDNDFGYNAIGLSYSGYISSGVGGSAEFILGGGDDIRREFSSTSLTSGPVYASFLINMSSGTTTSNEYVLGLTDASGTNHGRVYVGKSGSQYRLGVSKQSSGTPNNQTGLLNFGTTYLVVIKYNMKNEAGNTDTFELWVLSSGIPADEASAGTSITSTTSGTDATNLKYFALRQTGTYEGFVDGIRVGTTWADVVCNGTPASKTYTWTGGAGSTLWTAAGNWSPAGVPGTIDNIIINTAPASLLNITDCRQVKDFTLNGTGNFSIASTGTLTITGNITYGGTPTATLHCDSYVYITSSSAQTIPAINYGNLDALGGDRIFPNGATIGICAGFNVDPTVHSYTVTGSTINYFSSETGWGMFPFTYHNLTFSGTGSFSMGGGWDSYSGTKVVNVLGNFRQTNGTVNMTTNLYDFSNSSTLNITGNMEITGGTFNMKEGSDSSLAIVNLQGDLTVSTGTLTTTGSATSNFNFTGSGDGLTAATTQTVSILPNPQRTTFNINNGAYVKLMDQNFGLGTDSRLNVNSGGTLDFGFNSSNTALNVSGGSATFDSKTGSILKITSPGGIASSGATGNVRANTRLFATSSPYASYHYIGKTNQDTGSALPANVHDLTINNESSTSDVTLTSTVAVNNILTMANGNIVTGANRLDLGIDTATRGTLNHTEGVVKGTMRRWFSNATNSGATTGLFPLGTAANLKRFATLEYTSAPTLGGSVTAVLNETAMGNAALASLTPVPLTGSCPSFSVLSTDDSFWNLTPTTLTGGTYTITLRKQSSSTIEICKQTVLKRDLTDWLNPGTHIQPSGTSSDIIVSRSGLSGLMKNFGLGNANCPATSIVYNGSWPGSVLPTHLDTVEFTEDYPLDTGVIQMCECKVIAGKTVTIASGATLQLMNGITLEPGLNPDGSGDGQLIIEDGGSLVQVTDVDNATANNNTGSIKMHRYTKPMYRYDFTYWSSPVFANSDSSDDAASALDGTEFNLKKLSPSTLFDKYYKYAHDASTPGWQSITYGAESMVPGRGYIVRAPQNFPIEGSAGNPTPLVYNLALFTGKPNNGIVQHPVTGGAGKWNLIGNPYPSAISCESFLAANIDDTNTNPTSNLLLDGTLYFWTHNTGITPVAPGSQVYTYDSGDYASWNETGSAATTDTSLDPANIPGDYIAAGQSFFVRGVNSGSVIFNNSMRVAGNNNQFFRPAPTEPMDNWDTTGRHRVWLNIKGQAKGFSQMLVGYIQNATNDLDRRFDGETFGGNQVLLYSVVEDKKLVIQGRALPFNNQDEVPLGYKSTLNGTLTISIDHFDGLFEGQDIYLEDKVLDIVHDLKAAAYNFTTVVGTFNDRFVLRYLSSEELDNPDHGNIANGLVVYQEENKIMVKSQLEALEQVTVYDLLGRTIFDKSTIGKNEFGIENVVMDEQPLILKVKLANGQIVNRKIVY